MRERTENADGGYDNDDDDDVMVTIMTVKVLVVMTTMMMMVVMIMMHHLRTLCKRSLSQPVESGTLPALACVFQSS